MEAQNEPFHDEALIRMLTGLPPPGPLTPFHTAAWTLPKSLEVDSGSQEKNDRSNVFAGILLPTPFTPNFNVGDA